jgi:CxxC-x17-CxxC domain-containing protein
MSSSCDGVAVFCYSIPEYADRLIRSKLGGEMRSFPYEGRSGMEFVDRLLICADCGGEFVFTAGEQLFFLDKQFKNDPKRCKPCKSRRSAQVAGATGACPAAAGISRTETRTTCSECGIETTVPFKPTQGRPVLCRQCFKNKRPVAAPGAEAATANGSAAPDAHAAAPLSAPPAEQMQKPADVSAIAAAQASPAA